MLIQICLPVIRRRDHIGITPIEQNYMKYLFDDLIINIPNKFVKLFIVFLLKFLFFLLP